MASPQTTIGIIYDYDQTLSPTYMQDETLFPHFGINPGQFWKRSRELVDQEGYDGELAYLKSMLDYLELDRPSNQDLRKLGANLNFYKGLPEVFEELKQEATAVQAEGGAADLVFDLPLDLAAEVTGFRHDEMGFDDDIEPFTALERVHIA